MDSKVLSQNLRLTSVLFIQFYVWHTLQAFAQHMKCFGLWQQHHQTVERFDQEHVLDVQQVDAKIWKVKKIVRVLKADQLNKE